MENEKTTENVSVNETKKKKGKKKWIIIAVVLVIVVALFASSGEDNGPTVDNSGSSTVQSDAGADEETTADETKEIKAGSTVTDDYFSITYKKCNSDFKNYSQYADVKKDYKIVQAVFDFENVSETDQSVNGFTCYADGVKCDSFYSVDDYSDPWMETISAGRKLLDATVYYEVPEDAELIELEYEADFWGDEKYIFVIE